jgi:hypothetical protein
MSMLATFVQVEPGLLDQARADAGLTEALFAPTTPAAPTAGFDNEKMRAVIMARGPQVMAGILDMHPEMREQLEQHLGMTRDALRRGEGGDAILRLMQQRLGARPSGDVAGKHGSLSLDKAWHGVHYLLSGSSEPDDTPLGQAVLGGSEIGEDFSGYGPARALDAGLVADIARALDDPRLEDQARGRFDPQRMRELELYPSGWSDESLEWLLASLRELRSFYAGAAAESLAIVACLE